MSARLAAAEVPADVVRELLAEIDALRAEHGVARDLGAAIMREACAARLDARAESERTTARERTFANAVTYHLGAADALDEEAAALRAMPLRGT